ncbi:hypothetical protein HG531_009070 [Fusarium graminearum]|nr:hypothetical protein HG531_009070 [Fusarium graminearum]
MSGTAIQDVLPKDLMELQLGQIDLLMAMYASDNAISMDSASADTIEKLRNWCENGDEVSPKIHQTSIDLVLRLDDFGDDDSSAHLLQLTLSVPLACLREDPLADPPSIKTRIQQPDWMSKGDIAKLNSELPDEDILSVIEHIKEAATQHLESLKQDEVANAPIKDTTIVRVWFYFPSISTRAKRDDLVNYAPTYGLTGFLLAGKPGVLCLEGGSVAVDDFMKFIKTESWGDIPAHHKKVSERYREEATDLKRAFADMQEITDMIEKRGARGNRGDMKALEAWLVECGLGEAFSKILISGSSSNNNRRRLDKGKYAKVSFLGWLLLLGEQLLSDLVRHLICLFAQECLDAAINAGCECAVGLEELELAANERESTEGCDGDEDEGCGSGETSDGKGKVPLGRETIVSIFGLVNPAAIKATGDDGKDELQTSADETGHDLKSLEPRLTHGLACFGSFVESMASGLSTDFLLVCGTELVGVTSKGVGGLAQFNDCLTGLDSVVESAHFEVE